MAGEMESQQAQPKPVTICCCLKLEPIAYAFHLFHSGTSAALLAAIFIIVNEDWLFDCSVKGSDDVFYKIEKLNTIALHLSVAAAIQLLLVFATLYAVKKNYWRCIKVYLVLTGLVYLGVLLFIAIVPWTRGALFWSECLLIGIVCLGLFCLRQCLNLAINVDKYKKIYDYAISLKLVYV